MFPGCFSRFCFLLPPDLFHCLLFLFFCLTIIGPSGVMGHFLGRLLKQILAKIAWNQDLLTCFRRYKLHQQVEDGFVC